MNSNEFATKLKALKITELNKEVFKDLLKLPYSTYKPLIEMLLDGQLQPEDFMDSLGMVPAIDLASIQAKLTTATTNVDGAFIAEQSILKAKGSEYAPTKLITVDLKREAIALDESNVDKNLPYTASSTKIAQSANFDEIVTTTYNGDSNNAKKSIQRDVAICNS